MKSWLSRTIAGILVLGLCVELFKLAAPEPTATTSLVKHEGDESVRMGGATSFLQEKLGINLSGLLPRPMPKSARPELPSRVAKVDFRHGNKKKDAVEGETTDEASPDGEENANGENPEGKQTAEGESAVLPESAPEQNENDESLAENQPEESPAKETPTERENTSPAEQTSPVVAQAAPAIARAPERSSRPESASDWVRHILERNHVKRVEELVRAHRAQAVEDSVYFETAETLASSDGVLAKRMAVRLFGATEGTRSFIALAEMQIENPRGGQLGTEISNYLAIYYQQIENIQILNEILTSSEASDAGRLAAMEQIERGARLHLGEPAPGLAIQAEPNPSAMVFAGLFLTLEHVSNTDPELAQRAQNLRRDLERFIGETPVS